MIQELVTLAKIGNYSRLPLERAIQRFDGGGWCIVPLKGAVRCVLYEQSREPYLLTITRQKREPLICLGYTHNTVLTVTSHSQARSQEIARRFSEQTKIRLRSDAPDLLSETLERELNHAFEIFKQNPRGSVAFLRNNHRH
ncbi:MAG TPA: hypothetical protein VJ142_00555 [Candidatus Nanoarchaeia archaeon]|nr:hypothetical protein [Candidatus Nanoarchaeia archaeon]